MTKIDDMKFCNWVGLNGPRPSDAEIAAYIVDYADNREDAISAVDMASIREAANIIVRQAADLATFGKDTEATENRIIDAEFAWQEATMALAASEARVARLREALDTINAWSNAYPLTAFPEPDFKRARELLTAGGISLDAVSASNMRHVVEGVGEIARAALDGEKQ